MREILLAIGLGVGAGIIDIIPMVIKKLNKESTISAFFHWVILGIIISNSSIFGLGSWLNGLVISLMSAIPIIIQVFKDDKKSIPIILVMSAILGSAIGFFESLMGI